MLTNLEISERIYQRLKDIPQVKSVEILPSCQSDIDVVFRVIITPPRNWSVIKRIAEIISEAKWEIFEETKELPAIEWEVAETKG